MQKVSRTTKVAKRKPFEETLYGQFYAIFRTAGLTPDPKYQVELQANCDRIASLIQAESKLACITHMKRLQKAIVEALEIQDKKIQALIDIMEKKENSLAIAKIPEEISDN